MFRASLCPSSGEQDVCYCMWCAALVLLDVPTPLPLRTQNGAPLLPHPAEPAQHTTCSNTCLVLLKMGIMMPKTWWESVDNKHLTVASCWFSLSPHNLLTKHGHRNLKKKNCYSCLYLPQSTSRFYISQLSLVPWKRGRRLIRNFWHSSVKVHSVIILRCVIPVVCRKTNSEVNISHETTTMVVWICDGI